MDFTCQLVLGRMWNIRTFVRSVKQNICWSLLNKRMFEYSTFVPALIRSSQHSSQHSFIRSTFVQYDLYVHSKIRKWVVWKINSDYILFIMWRMCHSDYFLLLKSANCWNKPFEHSFVNLQMWLKTYICPSTIWYIPVVSITDLTLHTAY